MLNFEEKLKTMSIGQDSIGMEVGGGGVQKTGIHLIVVSLKVPHSITLQGHLLQEYGTIFINKLIFQRQCMLSAQVGPHIKCDGWIHSREELNFCSLMQQ